MSYNHSGYPPRYATGTERYAEQPGYPPPLPPQLSAPYQGFNNTPGVYPSSTEYERPPPLPLRPRSAQLEYAPVLPPRPYHAATPSSSSLAPPPPYYDVVPGGSRSVSPAPLMATTTSQPPVFAPKPVRPVSFSLAERPKWSEQNYQTPPELPRTTSETSTGSSDLLDAQDVKILEAGIDAIPAPSRSPSSYPPLKVPIVVPQLSVRSRLLHVMPFTRANAPTAQDYGITPAEFVRIIDTVNICIAASPPFQALHLAAAGVGIVPEPLFIGISLGMDAIASAGTRTTKYFRLKKFMEKINRQVWEPRGLEMRIVKDPELVRDMLGMNETALLAEMGERTEQEGLPEPLSAKRLRLLGDRVAPLDFDVPPPEDRGNIMDKISAKNQARKAERKKRKLSKRQQKYEARPQLAKEADSSSSIWSDSTSSTRIRSNAMAYDEYSSGSSDSDDSDIASEEEALVRAVAKAEADRKKVNAKADAAIAAGFGKKAERAESKREDELKRIEDKLGREREKISERREKRLGKRIKNNTKRQEKAGKRMQRLEWIVITNRETSEVQE